MSNELKENALLQEFSDQQTLDSALIARISDVSRQIVAAKGGFTLAVSGGRSPAVLFTSLAATESIPWEQGLITLVDERYVPPDSPDSNEHLLQSTLFSEHSMARKARFKGLYHSGRDIESQVNYLNQAVPGVPDIAILGLGMDGHTASLFPCSPEFRHHLATSDNYVSATPQSAPYQRISLSAQALISTPDLWLYIPGTEKLNRFQQILAGEDNASPLTTILEKRQKPLEVFTCP